VKRMNFLVAPLMLLASCGSSDGAAPKVVASENKAGPEAAAKPALSPVAESPVTVATPAKMDRRKYPGYYTEAELLAKGAVVVSGENLRQLLRGAEITPKKGTNPGPPWDYRFGCDGSGAFTSFGGSMSRQPFTMNIVNETAFLSFAHRPSNRALKTIQLDARNRRFFLSYGNGMAKEIDLGRSTDNLGSDIKC
jgi:hypothetical protein